ncbi:hypothetical protein K438DRAFT_1604362, partial [Mycena galopus ATCC 62051]
IRDKGYCPCPRCLIRKENSLDLHKMGLVYNLRARVTMACTYFWNKNAFAEKLGPFKFDFHLMLVVDHLHKWSLGVWKANFTHIIRVLYAAVPSGEAVATLNERFRQIPSFGRGTVRRFFSNAVEMKKLAGQATTTIIYSLCWNTLAKVRMHTETTLDYLNKTTTVIGRELRSFAATSQAEYKTVELPGETASRARRGARKKANTAAADPLAPPPPPPLPAVAKGKFLNLLTYKFHALGDYVRSIRLFGTPDSYSTQAVCPHPRHYIIYL